MLAGAGGDILGIGPTGVRLPGRLRLGRQTGNLQAALDQFRGYTVMGMFLVNFVGSFEAAGWLLKHHNTFCSYADTIMPQFFFAVGFAFRLTFCRRIESGATAAAYALRDLSCAYPHAP